MSKLFRFRALLALLGGLAYGASPIDLLPDVLPLIGVLDDAVVVPAMLVLGLLQLRKARKAKRAEIARAGTVAELDRSRIFPMRGGV